MEEAEANTTRKAGYSVFSQLSGKPCFGQLGKWGHVLTCFVLAMEETEHILLAQTVIVLFFPIVRQGLCRTIGIDMS